MNQRRLDVLGMGWSALCAVHCAALFALAGWGAAHHDDAHGHDTHDAHGGLGEQLEVGLVLGAALIAVGALARGVRLHGDKRPLALLGAGLALLAAARLVELGEAGEVVASCAGAATLIGAHAWNLALARRCGQDCC